MLSLEMDDYSIVSSTFVILKPEYISESISEAGNTKNKNE